MLLVHQTGSVKVGEVVRYTITYEPAADRILPSPSHLHLRIKNTSAIPLRAAYLHGPYCIYVAAYPSHFDPNRKLDHVRKHGTPQFEPMLKAGGAFNAKLTVPEEIRVSGHSLESDASPTKPKVVTWIVEVISQILFSASASVHYELLVSRDERSLDYNFHAVQGHSSHAQGEPGLVQDHQEGRNRQSGAHPAQSKGVYSRAVTLVVDDTTSLWNTPKLPKREQPTDGGGQSLTRQQRRSSSVHSQQPVRRKRKIHLVVLTHGLHSNLSADLLYLKESIDATAKQAREARRERKGTGSGESSAGNRNKDASTAPLSGGQEDLPGDRGCNGDEDEEEEEIIVRGFDGNATKTENGIQYLGKRMARWLLEITYPDQPVRPQRKSMSQKISESFQSNRSSKDASSAREVHEHSTIRQDAKADDLAYTFTSISFIGHSLGGLIQLYAIGYIQKHAPHFFEKIKPVNFVALASPLLGLSNENPMYVKFALDFGLVGRTGQDLGLMWRPPTLAKSGWSAVMGGLGAAQRHRAQEDPGAKPLLRILPSGPAHRVLRMFRNRTVYSNVVNDGIVPLRTSCLLFLDWRGLDKVEKARRENGLLGTMAGWGWAEITGQNPGSLSPSRAEFDAEESPDSDEDGASRDPHQSDVPQPSENATNEAAENSTATLPAKSQFPHRSRKSIARNASDSKSSPSVIDEVWSWIRPSGKTTKRDMKMYSRSQTLHVQSDDPVETSRRSRSPSPVIEQQPDREPEMTANGRPKATRGDSILEDPSESSRAPPKTTIFESAGDILNPPRPPISWITDPSTRARTIFHDRVYHPEDIPPPPSSKKGSKPGQSFSSEGTMDSTQSGDAAEHGSIRVEEKIARAYHKDLSWRKVLVRLEPDAHNNIIVRRMFANAYGWPVIKHLCDTHFGDTYAAMTRDEKEPALDRAKGIEHPVGADGELVKGQESISPPPQPESEMREAPDELAPLRSDVAPNSNPGEGPSSRPQTAATTSSIAQQSTDGSWDESYFRDTDDEDDLDERGPLTRFINPPLKAKAAGHTKGSPADAAAADDKDDDGLAYGTSHADITDFLAASPPPLEGHRGLPPTPRHPDPRPASSDAGPGQRDAVDEPPKSPASPSRSTAQALGLRRSLDGPVASTGPGLASASAEAGVAERVARSANLVDK